MLHTKLHIPSPGSNIVNRPHLIEKLNSGLERKRILVLDDFHLIRVNVNPTDDSFFKQEMEKLGVACQNMSYGDELSLKAS